MRVLSVVGARPQFVKLAPVASALAAQAFEHVIVHAGPAEAVVATLVDSAQGGLR